MKCAMMWMVVAGLALTSAIADVTVEPQEGKVRVAIDGELFTEYVYEGYAKPILYPVIGPFGNRLTRDYQMKRGTAGEAEDHPHHRSIFFTHGEVNDDNFWHESKTAGKIVQDKLVKTAVVDGVGVIEATHKSIGKKGEPVCTDTTVYRFGTVGESRFIDIDITVQATNGDVTFKDTKEGTMGIRTCPELRLKGKVAKGQAVNSAGGSGKGIWGKAAAWLDYYGPVNGKVVGIAIMDHPTNLRHPTTWHARDYGLIAANPFGLSYFQKKKRGTGNFTIKSGESQRFRYRFLLHPGDTKEAGVDKQFKAWCGEAK